MSILVPRAKTSCACRTLLVSMYFYTSASSLASASLSRCSLLVPFVPRNPRLRGTSDTAHVAAKTAFFLSGGLEMDQPEAVVYAVAVRVDEILPGEPDKVVGEAAELDVGEGSRHPAIRWQLAVGCSVGGEQRRSLAFVSLGLFDDLVLLLVRRDGEAPPPSRGALLPNAAVLWLLWIPVCGAAWSWPEYPS